MFGRFCNSIRLIVPLPDWQIVFICGIRILNVVAALVHFWPQRLSVSGCNHLSRGSKSPPHFFELYNESHWAQVDGDVKYN